MSLGIAQPPQSLALSDAELEIKVRHALKMLRGTFAVQTVARAVTGRKYSVPAETRKTIERVLSAMVRRGELVNLRQYAHYPLYRHPNPESDSEIAASTPPQLAPAVGSAPAASVRTAEHAGGQPPWFLLRVREGVAKMLADPAQRRMFRTTDLVRLLAATWDLEMKSPANFHRGVALRLRMLVDRGELRVLRCSHGPQGCVYTGTGDAYADVVAPPRELLPADSPMRPVVVASSSGAVYTNPRTNKKRISPERAERLRLLEHRRQREAALEAERTRGTGGEQRACGGQIFETKPRARRADVMPINPMRLSAHDVPSPIDTSQVKLGREDIETGDPRHRKRYHRGGMVKPGGRTERRAEVEKLFLDLGDDE